MFTYQHLLDDVDYLWFLGLTTGIIGQSEAGYNIPYLHYGSKEGKQIIITGGIHARENVSCITVIRQIYYLAKNSVRLNGGIYFVPMINVDGALLIEKGAEFFPERKEFLLEVNGKSNDFSLWKANINGVDLNTNFDADFGAGALNKTYPASSDYTGQSAFDQKESTALMEFTKLVRPSATVSYHALGQELYWFFKQTENKERDNLIAEKINKLLGYKKVDDTLGSTGGYKDWCVEKLGIPAFTIELGHASLRHPLTESDIEEDLHVNKRLPELLLEIINRN